MSFGITMLIVGTVIGAGFASGKELCTFFVRFGDTVYLLLALACVLFYVAFRLILSIADKVQVGSVGGLEAFHHHLYGRYYGLGVMILLTNNMLVTSSMLGAFDVIMPYAPLGSLLGAVICLACLLPGKQGLVGVNAIAVPLIIVLLIAVSVYGIFSAGGKLSLPVMQGNGCAQAILYVGMNVLTLGSVLSGFKTTRSIRRKVALFSTLIIGILMVVEVMSIRSFDTSIYNSEMPLLSIADRVGGLSVVARIVMALGIFTTLAACVHTVTEWLLPLVKIRALGLFVVLTIGFGVSRFGFGNIVVVLYPILGALGLVELGACTVAESRSLWQNRVVIYRRLRTRRRGRFPINDKRC